MTTVIRVRARRPSPSAIKIAASFIKKGGVVAYPTETLYGLGCDVFNRRAVSSIFKIKGRPEKKGLIILIASRRDLSKIVREVPPLAKRLMNKFWPGPLTIIFKTKRTISRSVTGGGNTVAVRLTSHPVARALIRASGTPITAPSANLSGKPPHRRADEVLREFKGRGIDLIIDGGATPRSKPSTIVDVTKNHPLIIREGVIKASRVQKAFGR